MERSTQRLRFVDELAWLDSSFVWAGADEMGRLFGRDPPGIATPGGAVRSQYFRLPLISSGVRNVGANRSTLSLSDTNALRLLGSSQAATASQRAAAGKSCLASK